MVQADASYPLAGLKVLDLSRVLAGPFAGRLLSDLGADVVKVEPPDGDITRLWGKVIGGVPGYYHQQNAGKRNICVDLRAPGGAALVLDLAKQADILIENYRPDVMPRLGLGYEALKAVNPRLIMLSISGFGHGGPESRRPAYAPIVHAEVGLMARTKHRDPGSRGDLPLSVADTNASLHGLIGVLSAVIMRERTGVGQHIDMAMVDATLATDDQIHYELEASEDTMGLPNDVWETGAGAILVSADFRHFFRSLTRGAGLADPAAPDMDLDAKIAARRAAVDAFMRALPDWDAVEAAMAQINIAWGRLRAGRDLAEQPTLRHRGAIAQVDDRAGGTRPIPQSPYRFSNASSGVRAGAPHRGEHNAEVLGEWLGLGVSDVAHLAEGGVLAAEIPRDMKRVEAASLDSIADYRLVERAPPSPGPGEVVVRVMACGVGYVDALVALGRYQVKPPLPHTPGSEVGGVIEALGQGVSGLGVGQRVMAQARGGFAELTVAPAAAVTPIPAVMSFAQAAGFRINYLTAIHGLADRAALAAGERLLVLGAAGGVGMAAVQVGALMGAHVIACASTEEKRAFALAHGAAQAIDNGADEGGARAWRDRLKGLCAGGGPDVIFDPVCGALFEAAFRSLAWRGRHLVVGFAGGPIPALPANLTLMKGAALAGVDVRQFLLFEPKRAAEHLETLLAWVAEGRLAPPVGRTFGLDDYAPALEFALTGQGLGKTVLMLE